MSLTPGSFLKPAKLFAAAAIAVVAMTAGVVSSAQAQSYDDGGYQPSGYNDNDDEDGYEDGQDAPDVGYFHDQLEDDGDWEDDAEYGQVWRPRRVEADWRPYSRGTWANTEEHGWYWVSDEPFGWATYHYGRWHLSSRRGWVWVPGTRWAPAWVAWRSNDDNIGWAPLPPEARWEHGGGLQISASIYEGPAYASHWSFVEPRYITTPRIYTYCAPRTRVINIINITRPQTNYVFVNRRIVNRGVSVTNIERVTRTRITTVRVNTTDNRTYRNVRRENNVINVYRPKLTRAVVNRSQARPIDRTKFRDVDRRAPRRDANPNRAGNQPLAGQRAPNYTGPAGVAADANRRVNTNPQRSLRNNDNPNFRPLRSDNNRNDRLQRIRERDQNRNFNRNRQGDVFAAPPGAKRPGSPFAGQPQARVRQGPPNDPQAEARRRQRQQQRQQNRKNNQNDQ